MDEGEELFQIDIDVEETKEGEPVKQPDYEVDYMLTKNDWEDGQIEDNTEEPVAVASSEKCWNCGKGGHNLRECPMPVDRIKISQSKKAFVKNQVSNKRYHDNKFAKFRAGHHSSKLREALGLRRDEIPRHIYMMRVLGYPPGWLAEAKITNSGIKMYNSRGKRIKEVDEEDGEILNKFMKYDTEKIVEYPGFNVSLDRGVKDDCRAQGFPSMKPEHELANFIKHLEDMSTNTDVLSDSTDDEHVDMDLSEMLPSEIMEEVRIINRRINKIKNENESSDSRSMVSNDSYEEGEIVTRKTEGKPPATENELAASEAGKIVSKESSAVKHLENETTTSENAKIVSSESPRTIEGSDPPEAKEEETSTNDSSKSNEEPLKEINACTTVTDVTPLESDDVINNVKSVSDDNDVNNITNTEVNNSRKRSLPPDDNDVEFDESKKLRNSKSTDELIQQNETSSTSENENTQDTISNRSEMSEKISQVDESSVSSLPRSQPITIPLGRDPAPSTPSPRGSVTNSSFGTPHMKQHSPFSKLPSVENFNKNISDVIDFENLPDSVGKYESLCNIISKVRSFMSSKSSKK